MIFLYKILSHARARDIYLTYGWDKATPQKWARSLTSRVLPGPPKFYVVSNTNKTSDFGGHFRDTLVPINPKAQNAYMLHIWTY